MPIFTRLFEKLMGYPHQHFNAEMVRSAAAELRTETQKLSAVLAPYQEEKDPLLSLMIDIKKARRSRERGERDESS